MLRFDYSYEPREEVEPILRSVINIFQGTCHIWGLCITSKCVCAHVCVCVSACLPMGEGGIGDFFRLPRWPRVKIHLPMQEMCVRSLGQKDSLEEGMATHSDILHWRIPWTEESGGLQSMGSQRIRHDWVTEHTHTRWFLQAHRFQDNLRIWDS